MIPSVLNVRTFGMVVRLLSLSPQTPDHWLKEEGEQQGLHVWVKPSIHLVIRTLQVPRCEHLFQSWYLEL